MSSGDDDDLGRRGEAAPQSKPSVAAALLQPAENADAAREQTDRAA